MSFCTHLVSLGFISALALFSGCGGSDDDHTHNEAEVISTVTLTFTPLAGGPAVVAAFDDPDGDGGQAPTIDPIELASGSYDLAVTFENKLEDPAEDITLEVMDESDQHQLFFTGTAVNGPAANHPGAPLTHSYDDTDVNGLPIGLTNMIVAVAGTGDLTVTLRHTPPVNDTPVKVVGLAESVSIGGISALPGETDASVTFAVTVE